MTSTNKTQQSKKAKTSLQTVWITGALVRYGDGWSIETLNPHCQAKGADSESKLAVSPFAWLTDPLHLWSQGKEDVLEPLLFDKYPKAVLAVFYVSHTRKQPPKDESNRLFEAVGNLLSETISTEGYAGPKIIGNLACCLVPIGQVEKQELDFPALFSPVSDQAKGTLWQRLVVDDLGQPLWHYPGMDQLPDQIVIKDGLEAVLKLSNLPTLSNAERAGMKALCNLGQGVLEGDIAIVANSRASVKALVDKVKDLSPEEFFAWFDREHTRIPLTKLQSVVKAWIRLQVGKHGFEELVASEAVAKKYDIARGVQDVLDRVGLSIVCQHVYRDTQEVCGQVGRLNAKLQGNSVSGQYLIMHGSASTGRAKHSLSSVFPDLVIA